MAVRVDPGIVLPESTGNVTTPAEPVTTMQTVEAGSTNVVAPPAPVTVVEFGPVGPVSTNQAATPGPVTTRNPAVKVVRPPARPDSRGQTTAETAGNPPTTRPAPPQQPTPPAPPPSAPAEGR